MTIETKYNIGNEVWTLDIFGKPQKGKILSISTFNIYKYKDQDYISYYVYPVGSKKEYEVFSTKEELLKLL